MYSPRPSITLSQRLRLSFGVLLALTLLATILAGCGVRLPAGEPVQPAQLSSSSPDTPLDVRGLGSMAPYAPVFLGEEVKSIEEAQSRVDFHIAVPGVVPGDYKLTWIGTSPASNKGEPEGQFVRLVYSDGKHYIIVGQSPSEPTMELAPFLADEWLTEHHVQKVAIRGYPGFGHGAITVEQPVAVVEEQLITASSQVPAHMQWWAPGVLRAVWTPDDLSITLEDLIAMAESMEPAQ